MKRPLPVSEYLCPEIKKEASEDENIPERDLKPVPGRSHMVANHMGIHSWIILQGGKKKKIKINRP